MEDTPWQRLQRLYAEITGERFGEPIVMRREVQEMTDEDIQLEYAVMRSELRVIELCSHKGEFCAVCWSRETNDE